jgi:putative membrane protein
MGPVNGTIESIDHARAYELWRAITDAAVAAASAESAQPTDGNAVEVEWPEAASVAPPLALPAPVPPLWVPPDPPTSPTEER